MRIRTNRGRCQTRTILLIVTGYAAAFVVFGLAVQSPAALLRGLADILTTRDALLTDYFGVGGIGGGCVNAGLLTLAAAFIYLRTEAKITGASVAALFLVLGFGLFGKNLLNAWVIVFGVYIFARFRRETFATHINTAFFGAALAPVFSEILFSTSIPLTLRVPLAVATSLVIGFVLAPAAAHLFKTHMGFSLYNMGFTAGIVGTLIVAMYKSYGFVPDPVFIWTTGNNRLLATFLSLVFASMLGAAYVIDRFALARVGEIMRAPGQAPTDFIAMVGFGPTPANMALTGLIGMIYVLAIGGDLNGPMIGAILTIVGFSAYGKTSGQHRSDHAWRLRRFVDEALDGVRSVSHARGAVRHDACADWGALRLAMGHRRRRCAFVRRVERRAAARRPRPVQQRFRRGHRGFGPGPGDPRSAGGVRLRRPGPECVT